MLYLLTDEALAGRFDALVEEARRQGAHDGDLEALQRARQLALTLHAQMLRREQVAANLAALVDTACALVGAADLDDVLATVTRRARLLFGLDLSYVTLREGDTFPVRRSVGHVSALMTGLRVSGEVGLGSRALTTGAPAWTADYLVDQSFGHDRTKDDAVRAEGIYAAMAVPLSEQRSHTGVLYVAGRRVRTFAPDEVALMGSLGELAGAAIERARALGRATSTVSQLRADAAHATATLGEVLELGDVHRRLIELVLGGCDLAALARETSRRFDAAVQVVAAHGDVLVTEGVMPELDASTVARGGARAEAAREPVRLGDALWAAPVLADKDSIATLLLSRRRPLTDRDVRLLCAVGQAVAVLLLLHDRGELTQAQLRDELLGRLLSPQQPAEATTSSRRLGLDLCRPHVLAVARPEDGALGRAAAWARSYAHRVNGVTTTRGDCLVLLIPGTDAHAVAQSIADELTTAMQQPVTVHAADPVTGSAAVPRAYSQARRGLDAMTALGATGRSASASELGFAGMLLSDDHDAEGFITATIGPVVTYDEQHFTELTRTLEAYFGTGSSPLNAAKALHVHPNTVTRRLKRIDSLLGVTWQKPERALDIQLALRLARIGHVLRERQPGAGREPAPQAAGGR